MVAINEGLARGMKDFGIKVYTILCCMTHRPGIPELFVYSVIIYLSLQLYM